jgi:gliding motility-associated-like protein
LKFFDDNHSDNSGQLVFKLYTIQTPTIWSTGQTNDSIWVNPIQTTTYWVNQTLNGKSCSDSVTIVVNQGIQASDTTICDGENVTLSTVSGQSAIWSTGDTATTITVNPATTTKYWATTFYVGGTCSDTLTVFVNAPSIHGQTHSCNSNDSLLLWTTNTSTSTPNSVLPQCNSLNGSLNNGLVAYYPFCGNADDLSNNGNHGVVNGASLASDRFGKPNSAYIFDGSNDFIEIANSTSLSQSNTNGLTLSCWIKHDQVWQNPKWLYVISKTDGTIQNGDGGYILRAGADGGAPFGYVPVFKTINGGNQFSSTNPITDVWEHLCLTYNNDTARFYRDGVLVNQYLSGSSSLKPNTRDLILGASVSNSNYFKGVLDEVGIWDRALTQDEVIQLMNTGTGEVSTLWSTSQTTDSIWIKPTQTTTYWIEQSLNGVTCSDSAIVFINKVNIEPSLPTICASGDSVLLYAPGVEQQPRFASNQAMNWSNGASNDSIWLTPTQDSDYWLTSSINGEGCSDTVSLRILEPTITASTTTSCSPGDSIMLYYNGFNGASGDESILWSTGETSDTIWVTPTTTSTYSVTASRGGVNCLDFVQIDVTTLSNFDPLIPTRIHCEATNTVLDGTDGSAISYNWSTGTQTSSTTVNTSGQYWVQATDNLGCSFSDTTQLWLSNIQSNLSSVEPTCYGLSNGNITPNPTGGVVNYTYLWSNGDTNAALTATTSGLHWVTITDSVGCSVQDSILLDQPLDLAATAAAISDYNGFNIPCFGGLNGQALATVSGGTLPYTYSWSNGSPDSIVYSLAAGTHTVNIMDSNGCVTSDTVLITQPLEINTSLAITTSYNGFDISCFGVQDGGLQLTASGGVTPYQHYWSNGANGTNISNIGAGLYTVNTVDANGCSSVDSITLIQPNILTSTATVISNYNGFSVSCFGASDGSAQVSALGGNAPYVYSWSSGTTSNQNNGIGAGSYSVIVTDTNGCTVQTSVVLSEPTELQISTSITSNFNGYSISCTGANDGSAMVSGSGGTAPYTILWSNGDTSSTSNNLSAGTYFVTITDANGCSKSDSVVLTDPIGLSNLTLSVSSYNGYNISCNGGNDGNISMTGVNGGTAPLSYSWNTGDSTSSINGITAGNYTLTVTDINGCSISDSLTLNQPAVLTSNAWATSNFNGTNISCNGAMDGSAQVSGAGGVAPYTFLWNTSDTSTTLSNLGVGSYNVVVTDANGCTTIDTVTLNEPSVFTLSAGIQSNYNGYHISCAGGANGQVAALATGGTGPYTYNWSNGSNSTAQNNLAAGTYIINVSDANGCSAADTLTLIEPPVLSSIASVSSNYNGFNISCQGAQDGIANANTQGGVTPYSINWSNGASGASVSNLGAGVHTVTIQDANGCSTNASVNLTEPAGVTVTATSSSASCYGSTDGSASITVAGGTGSYNIQWSNGATGLNLAGIPSNWYSFTITTSPNCFLTDSIWVDQPTPLVIQVDTIPPTCISAFDGEINVVAFGGTPGYQYFINGSLFSGFADELGTDSLEIIAVDRNNCDTTMVLAMPAQTQSCLFIPNWFTPNGNNQEDIWRIEGFEYENLRLKVFNVMGQLIYTTESSTYIPWNGNYNGRPLPEGDYYYLIESTVNDSRYSGYVTLLR